MNIVFLTAGSFSLADIVVGPPPPPPDLVSGPLFGHPLAALAFWALAVVAGVALWRMRRRSAASLPPPVAEPK